MSTENPFLNNPRKNPNKAEEMARASEEERNRSHVIRGRGMRPIQMSPESVAHAIDRKEEIAGIRYDLENHSNNLSTTELQAIKAIIQKSIERGYDNSK